MAWASRKTRKGRQDRAASKDKARVRERQQGICFGWGVNPHCWRFMWDAHELIPQGQGGPQESWNRVGVCRNCHQEAQGRVGGNRLLFHWKGKDDGAKPNADQPGNVWCTWRGKVPSLRADGRTEGPPLRERGPAANTAVSGLWPGPEEQGIRTLAKSVPSLREDPVADEGTTPTDGADRSVRQRLPGMRIQPVPGGTALSSPGRRREHPSTDGVVEAAGSAEAPGSVPAAVRELPHRGAP